MWTIFGLETTKRNTMANIHPTENNISTNTKMHFTSLAVVLAACSTLTAAFDPRAALAKPDPHAEAAAARTRCTTFLSTVVATRTRGDVDTSTSTILLLKPTVTTIYETITSTSTYLVTNDRTRERTRTETVSHSALDILQIELAAFVSRFRDNILSATEWFCFPIPTSTNRCTSDSATKMNDTAFRSKFSHLTILYQHLPFITDQPTPTLP
ncbi:uncharacterized protein BDR25DRAFT_350668 [Lindgomyces ingoldianus]|uniref:Uncharacterized protein n=1 Tax=Lindgomyces ingoldianus TaxID=673940 RepID=A0ACB6R9Z3_9PLEO|nr:uncharacterized protein BDR25DRAFT_350668 [Lindgomyces ingoldianus]KAF2475281.1 hypothetical protein BDR25DRAFT_350668 [Lindgomyces ingoldianus]